jgi:hypothetical protein
MSLQSLFRRFHETIQLTNLDQNAELRDKRDRVLERLRRHLDRTFTWFNQGSYAVGTGIRPIHGDYDIDVGIVFDLGKEVFDPNEVKRWVYEAVRPETPNVDWREPCITVYYAKAQKIRYHVDLAVFRKDPKAPEGTRLLLARGKEHAAKEDRKWQFDDRRGFIKRVEGRHHHPEEAAQFRRVIRYLKRWKDEQFTHDGREPSGHSLTVAAERWFQPRSHGKPREYDDLGATLALVQLMVQQFRVIPGGGSPVERLSLRFPALPEDDVFARLSDEQMKQFKGRLIKLASQLDEARTKDDPAPLRRAFGADFPEKK